MAANHTPLAVQNHPMRHSIVSAYLAGQSLRNIATWTQPPVSHAAIRRYIVQHVQPIMGNADALKALLGTNSVAKKGVGTAVTPDTGDTDILLKAIDAGQILSIRENRVAVQQDRHRRLMQVVQERGADMELCESCRRPRDIHPWEDDTTGRRCDVFHAIPGGSTGLITRKLKATGTEYAVDTGLLSELRETEKQIAMELNQWQEGFAAGGVSIQIVCPQAPDATAGPRVTYAQDDGPALTIDDICVAIGPVSRT